MPKVKSIQIITNPILHNLHYKVGVNGVDRIEDRSLEYESSFYSMFLVYDREDDLIESIENCPVVVKYYKDKDDD